MRVFGITGGIGCGKSAVSALLRNKYGIPVLDADQLSRKVVEPGSVGLVEFTKTFPADLLNPDGTMDRRKTREYVLAHPAERVRLEKLLHPLIQKELNAWIYAHEEEGHNLICVENALMVEQGSWVNYDSILVVSATPETQIRRVMERDQVSEDSARTVVSLQMPLSEKEKVATWVVRNDTSMEDLEEQVDIIVATWT